MHESPVRTVCVEFLRAGPPNNQLLSPLTRYLAVCGDGRVGEVSVPYEHSEFVRRLRDLRYRSDREDELGQESNRNRQAALLELSKQMAGVLSEVPGLATQLASRHCGTEMVHLQFVVTAAELAMLPFELAGSLEQPGSAPGSFLQLGGKPLISITRRARGMSDRCVEWPQKPRILFVAANSGGEIPYQEHVDALVKALQPWLPPLEVPSNDIDERRRRYGEEIARHLVLLEEASIGEIAEHCSSGEFTHVHVLAHGAIDTLSPGRGFGLALHAGDDKRKVHVVSGSQFASALRRDGGQGGPTVVTLAACDSGNVQDVMYTGASFAHDLHSAGVPVVVASQFPLTIAGSSIMTRVLYSGLLLGMDPRPLLSDVRLRLHSVFAGVAHDWASLVTYAVMPPDFDRQLETVRYVRARRAVDTALQSLDTEMGALEKQKKSSVPPANASEILEKLFAKLDDALALLPAFEQYGVERLGLMAAAAKRKAECCFFMISPTDNSRAQRVLSLLEGAMEKYARAFRDSVRSGTYIFQNAPLHWALTQQLSLSKVLTGEYAPERWQSAMVLAEDDRHGAHSVTWSYTSLIELLILQWWTDQEDQSNAIDGYMKELIALCQDDKFPLHSTERQLRRYLDWWWSDGFHQFVPHVPLPTGPLRQKVAELVLRLRSEFNRGRPA